MLFRGVPGEIVEKLARVNQPFSVWAKTNSGLLAARDHLGVAPLFYARGGPDGWTVATTVGEIVDRLPHTGTRPDETSVVAHLAGLSAPRLDSTFFSNIRAVPPGTLMRFTAGGSERIRYWDPADHRQRSRVGLDEAAQGLRELVFAVLADAVPGQPVAATLSSGMDSTTVLAALAGAGADVEAITWTAPDNPESDETRWARMVSWELGIPLVEIPVRANELLPESGIVTRRSTPLFNMFDHTWRVACATVAGMDRKVLFTGFSGDHLFGGWVPAAADLLLTLRLGDFSDHMTTARDANPETSVRSRVISPIARQLLPGVAVRRSRPVPWLHTTRLEIWRERRRQLISPGLLPGRAERISKLTDGIIPQLCEDLASQARPHDVEMSHPLLDRRLVEYALTLPSWLLNDGATDKLVLRRAMRGRLPDDVLQLDGILPGAIARQAMRARQEPLMRLTRNMRAADLGYVNEPALADNVAAFMRGEHDDMSFWNALTLEDWLRRWW